MPSGDHKAKSNGGDHQGVLVEITSLSNECLWRSQDLGNG